MDLRSSYLAGKQAYYELYVAGEAGTSTHAIWRLRAPATPQNGVLVQVRHSHSSYGESFGPQIWNMPVDVTPNPDLIFADGFELGNTLAWSSTVP